jgi:hypothetical protein
MLATALIDCQKNSLEKIHMLAYTIFACGRKNFWNQELAQILQFNRERRLFLENASSCSDGKQLLQALVLAKNANNHHLRFWLVRNHAGDLSRGLIEPVQARQGKRKRIGH